MVRDPESRKYRRTRLFCDDAGLRLIVYLSSCTLRPEWTWFVIKGFRSISANVVVLIDRIIVPNDRKISPRPLLGSEQDLTNAVNDALVFE
jgi:hypothetical protein